MSMKRSLIYITLVGFSSGSYSVPYNIAQDPIGVGQGVEPNVVFIMDDSGSMDWEVMTRDFSNNLLLTGTQPDGSNVAGNSLKNRDSNESGTANCNLSNGSFYGYLYGVEFGSNTYSDDGNDCNTADDEEWRFRNSDFNVLYFDPNSDYLPWVGVDSSGNDYTDVVLTNAYDDPYTKTETINLATNNSNWTGTTSHGTGDRDADGRPDGFRFYTWSDADSDGNFDDGEETEYQIGKVTQAQINAANWQNPDGTVKTVAELQQDFANWFTYWRSRDLVARGAIGSTVAVLNNMKIGFTTINTTDNNFEVQKMNPDFSSGEKRNLLNKVFNTPIPSAGTPLRNALYGVGRYFECQAGNRFDLSGYTCPVVADEGQCRQNYAILMTDGFYNGAFNFPGTSDNKDGGTSNSVFDGNQFADSYSNTLGDIAMDFYERDLSPLANLVPATLRDSELSRYTAGVPSIQKNDSMHQQMKTYTISFGVEGSFNWASAPPATWSDPSSNAGKVDDLLHAAYNGRGDYYNAENPQALQTSIASIFSTISANVGSQSYLAFSAGSVQDNTVVYAGTYNTLLNTGTFSAYPIVCSVLNGNQRCQIDPNTPNWDAGVLLTSRAPNTRKIVTYDPLLQSGIPFQYASLNATQIATLNLPLPAGLPASFGAEIADERLAYLRGDRTNEGDNGDGWGPGEFRERASLLGDIINSSPYYLGLPLFDPFKKRDKSPWPTATGKKYSDFAADSSVQNRMRVVYVGANDGMLHAFNADTGKEEFAYIPSFVFPNLTDLTDPNYQHRMYVDYSPSVVDVFTSNSWKSVLIGGVGAGGRGIYAIDVTRPSTASGFGTEAQVAGDVLWEFSSDDDADLGYTFTQPVVAMTNATSAGEQQWVAIVGNGINSTGASGDSAIFLLKMEGPAGASGWTGEYIKLSTGFGLAESTDGTTPNGITEVRAVDIDTNGTVDYVYAGDVQGRLHRFNLTATTWAGLASSTNVETIFRALDSAGNPQPITVRPVVVNLADPTVRKHSIPGDKDVIVVFGTGSWFSEEDGTSTGDHTIYGIADKWGAPGYSVSFPRPGSGDLVQQSFGVHSPNTQFTNANTGQDFYYEVARGVGNNMVDYGTKKGWYMDLQDSPNPYPGERAVGRYSIITRDEDVVVNTTSVLPLSGNCGTQAAERGFIYALDAINGGRPEAPFFDFNADGEFNEGDNVNGGNSDDIVIKTRDGNQGEPGPGFTTCIGSHCYTGLDFDYLKQDREGNKRTGRLSWQELQ